MERGDDLVEDQPWPRVVRVESESVVLANAVATQRLDTHIAWRGSWDKATEATTALLDRRLHGKAVLDLT
ncbi:hypothetical protein OG874_42810 [Nocardia sp. NBC_00565]|uniref:hypothetical protein n=1 Tax=Nocardia sp. NBC_00565 TaxID=2975993 RepID=UPI002E8112C0|nr:hypothetical protein [Nocardia sp. NBC_00565]WUC03320.1 hypothetical protein OG874_42810 [Nocardia sp. NBC_00565]